jgi:hypothetical protein
MMITRSLFKKQWNRINPFLLFNKSGEKGSITVLIVLLLPIMILMLALVVNINQLIFTKMKLQNTVDACALSAAAVQAAGLNEIADLNIEMAMESQKAGYFLSSGTWYDFQAARATKDFFYNSSNGVIDWIRKYQRQANQTYAEDAERVAQHVKQLNFPQSKLTAKHNTGQLTYLKEHFYDAGFMYYSASYPDDPPVLTQQWFNPDDPRFADAHDGRISFPAQRMTPLYDSFRILEKTEKKTPTYVDYDIMLPAHPFVMADAIFRGVPTLRATAAARPAGGNIYRQRPSYRAVLVK